MKLKKNTGIKKSNPTQELLNETFISMAMWECLKNGDSEGIMEIIETYLEALNTNSRLAH